MIIAASTGCASGIGNTPPAQPTPLFSLNPAPPLRLFRRTFDKHIFRFTGAFCTDTSCPGWQLIHFEIETAAMTANLQDLFILRTPATRHLIMRWTGTPCENGRDDRCFGWEIIDNNLKTDSITGADRFLYQLRNDGSIARWTGVACSGQACTGWEIIRGSDQRMRQIAAGYRWLYARDANGEIWRFDGRPGLCFDRICPAWRSIGRHDRNQRLVVAGQLVFVMRFDGELVQWAPGITPSGDRWVTIDRGHQVRDVATDGWYASRMDTDGSVWLFRGPSCSATACTGWIPYGAALGTAIGRQLTAERGRLFRRREGVPGGHMIVEMRDPSVCSSPSCDPWRRIADDVAGNQMTGDVVGARP